MFADPAFVGDCLVSDLIAEKPINKKLDMFLDYIVENYIEEEATFPPELWASKSASNTRTTNACESFHSHLNKCFNFAHPHIFVFVEALKDYQSEIYIQIQSVNKYKKPNSKTQKRVQFLENQICKLTNGIVTKLDYVKLTSHYYSNNV